jgi:hypothetical protein
MMIENEHVLTPNDEIEVWINIALLEAHLKQISINV